MDATYINSLTSNRVYNKNDISFIGKNLVSYQGFDHRKQFHVIESMNDFESFLNNNESLFSIAKIKYGMDTNFIFKNTSKNCVFINIDDCVTSTHNYFNTKFYSNKKLLKINLNLSKNILRN
jgi:hypothetical protein